MIGRRLSHYRIVEVLGSGLSGTVCRAEDTLLARPVALRLLNPSGSYPEQHERFLREARTASALDHPHLVALHDVAEVEGVALIAMHHVDGCSLRVRLGRGPVPADEAMAIARAVAEALAYAHGRGVIHGDLAPENILLGAGGHVKVAQLGTAHRTDHENPGRYPDFMRAFAHLAPEILEGHDGGERGDLYALGVTLHEMLSGAPPYRGDNAGTLIYQILHTEPAPLPVNIDPVIRRLVASLLAKRPDDRPRDAVALLDALARVSDPAGERPTSAPAPPARTLAVLGFENLARDPAGEDLCASLTEDLTTDLRKLAGLHLASRGLVAALESEGTRILEAVRRADFATVLQCGARRSGDRVRVTAQLLRTDTGYQMWAERYSRDLLDLPALLEEITRHVAAALRLAFESGDPESRRGRRARVSRAYDLRLAAGAYSRRFEGEATRRAIGLLEEAVREDPDYALARAEWADACVRMVREGWDADLRWLERAEAEATRALELALPEAHLSLGRLWMVRHEPDRALPFLHRASELDPRCADGLLELGGCYLLRGDPSRAAVPLRRAAELDPGDGRAVLALAIALLRQRCFHECRAVSERVAWLTSAPGLRLKALETLLLAHLGAGRLVDVPETADRVRNEFGERDAHPRALLGLAAAAAGRREDALALLADPPSERVSTPEAHIARARVHALLGDREAALTALERTQALGITDPDELRSDLHLGTLAGDPRFDRIVNQAQTAHAR